MKIIFIVLIVALVLNIFTLDYFLSIVYIIIPIVESYRDQYFKQFNNFEK